MLDISWLYYLWGDVRFCFYISVGLGIVDYEYVDVIGIGWGVIIMSFLLVIGLKYYVGLKFIVCLEVEDNIMFLLG